MGWRQRASKGGEFSFARPQLCGARGRARCTDATDERSGGSGEAPRGIARHESDPDDRRGNIHDSRSRSAGGAFAFLDKPVEGEGFLNLVRQALRSAA